MLPCKFTKDGKRLTCVRCGRVLNPKHDWQPERAIAPCKSWPFWHEFGHWLSFALTVAGVSPSGWNWLRYRLGLIKPCNCEARKEWMNTLGGRLVTWLESKGPPEPSP